MKAYLIDNNKLYFNEYYSFLITDSANMAARLLSYLESGAAIISASRDEYTNKENLVRTAELEKDLSNLHYGFRPSAGGYKETNELTKEEVDVEELSFIVPKPKDVDDIDFLNDMLELGRKYKQQEILVILPNLITNPSYVDCRSGKPTTEFTNVGLRNNSPYFTRLLKGKTPSFTFKMDSKHNPYMITNYNGLTVDDIAEYYSHTKLSPNAYGLTKNKYTNKYNLNDGSLVNDSEPRFKK